MGQKRSVGGLCPKMVVCCCGVKKEELSSSLLPVARKAVAQKEPHTTMAENSSVTQLGGPTGASGTAAANGEERVVNGLGD
ncbi:hypothetical protein NDU88_000043 [Pleurodeles waltl]|uniref:Uncharacterized protein n=1 Tax=Pleurodeles waltl TaxID=8319 RepID=A0AAV7TEQ7_PLEWA|nr:hypothetical protein NDU88_000043 [Pleurodeles waltl]